MMGLPFDLHDELKKLRKLELEALKADNAVLRQRIRIFQPLEQECGKQLSKMEAIKNDSIKSAIQRNGTIDGAARELGIGRSTIYKRLRDARSGNGHLALIVLILFLAGCASQPVITPRFIMPPVQEVSPPELAEPPATASVTVAWDPSPDSTVVGYKFYHGTGSRSYSVTNDVGPALVAYTQGLSIGTTYYFAATAYNSLGTESVFSDELVYTIPAPRLQIILNGAEAAFGPWLPISTNYVTPDAPMKFFIQQIKWK